MLPAPEDKAAVVRAMFDRIAPRYDRLNSVLTLSLDRAWRRATIDAAEIRAGDRVIDVACGSGDLLELATGRGARAVGVDFAGGMLEVAAARGMRGRLVRGDALVLPFPDGCADALTCGFALRNLVAIRPFLDEAARVLRPGGRLALLEVATPDSPWLRAAHGVYFRRAVPWIGRLLADRDAYAYLPESAAYLPSPEDLAQAIQTAGFSAVRRRTLGFGATQLLSARRAGGAEPGR